MKIKNIRYWKQNLGLSEPYTISYKTVDSVENTFVEIETFDGITGIGSCNPSEQVVGETADDSYHLMQETDWGWLIGSDLREINKLSGELMVKYPENPGFRCAVDIALYDAFTKTMEIPLAAYLGKKINPLSTSVTIGIMKVQETVEKGKEFIKKGFDTLKVKLGNDLDEDIERIWKLREVLGNEIIIRVDANQGYSFSECKSFIDKTRELNIELIEQPLPVKDDLALKELPVESKRLLAADESLVTLANATELDNRYGIYNIKLMKSGGITPSKSIAFYAELKTIDLMWGCNDESKVSIAAALHLAYSCPNTRYIDLDGSFDLAQDVVTGGFQLKDGYMHLLDKPGLGVNAV